MEFLNWVKLRKLLYLEFRLKKIKIVINKSFQNCYSSTDENQTGPDKKLTALFLPKFLFLVSFFPKKSNSESAL